jgi:hypothetical protein
VKEDSETMTAVETHALVRDQFREERMLGDGENVGTFRLAVPARHARKPVGDVLDLDIERGGIEQIKPAPRQHALPGAECM